MGTAAAVILVKERHIVEAFERAGATGPGHAMAPGDVPVDPVGIAMRRLRSRAVVREAAPDRFYADLEVWHALRRTRRRAVLVLLVLTALIIAGTLVGTGIGAHTASR
ncbi:MAG TPA: hypothetical protein VGD56_00350 [Gemmatirosa sp.]